MRACQNWPCSSMGVMITTMRWRSNPDIQLNSWPDGGVAGVQVYGTHFHSCCISGIATAMRRACAGRRTGERPSGIQNTLNKIDPGKQADDLVADWLMPACWMIRRSAAAVMVSAIPIGQGETPADDRSVSLP